MINTTWKPWISYPELTEERLTIVAHVIRAVRDDGADDHRPDKGETNWSLGVRDYERTCWALTDAQQRHAWLQVVAGAGDGPVHFVMCIAGLPIRFYRGGADDIPSRYRYPSFPEMVEQQRVLALDRTLPANRCLRIAIENDVNGKPDAISLVQLDKKTGEATDIYVIPRIADGSNVTEFAPPVQPIDLPPVSAEPIDDEAAKTRKKTRA